MNAEGEALGATADVAPVNFWLHALFSQIDMTLKDTLVTNSNNTYPYKAYLSFGTESKQSQLTASIWYKDTNNFSLDQNNKGYVKRKALDMMENCTWTSCSKITTYSITHQSSCV